VCRARRSRLAPARSLRVPARSIYLLERGLPGQEHVADPDSDVEEDDAAAAYGAAAPTARDDRRAHEWRLSPAEMLGLLVGVAAHDVDHTGQTNAFHVATGSELAITYNDVSVLESHHCAFAFRALAHAGLNFASVLERGQFKAFREAMVSVILGTDMSKHFEHVLHLQSTIESHPLELRTCVPDRRFLMQTAAHAADLSNSCRLTKTAVAWSMRYDAAHAANPRRSARGAARRRRRSSVVRRRPLRCVRSRAASPALARSGRAPAPPPSRPPFPHRPRRALPARRSVTSEFYAQGDLEKASGLPVTAFFDRDEAQLAKSQLGFYDFIVRPLYELLTQLLDCDELLEQLTINREYWAAR
jgi:hypothetical protein